MTMQPMFTHDCTKCKHLGTVYMKGEYHDLYTCPHGVLGPTLIARWGDMGHEYESTPVSLVDPDTANPEMRIALIAYKA